MKAGLAKAVKEIEAAGFGYIKFELEAHFNRETDMPCTPCNQSGRMTCTACQGKRFIERLASKLGLDATECEQCYGSGRIQCTSCHGNGYQSPQFYETSTCQRFIKSQLSRECKRALIYERFYRDGSVDSEDTFTLPIRQVEYALELVHAFKALGEACGRGIDVDGAGMHISLIPTESQGVYPYRHWQMPAANIANFQREVTKLLPAFYFLASSGHQSRRLYYRMPRISSSTKYSAIYTHGNTCFEYRIFETCYDRPETIFDYVQVIAQTIKFYADPTLRVQSLNTVFEFPHGNEVNRFFDTVERLRVINATVKHIKPFDKSYKQLRSERGVVGTVKHLQQERRIKVNEIKEDYKQHKTRYDEAQKRPLNEYEQSQVDRLMIDGYSYDEAIRRVRGVQPLLPENQYNERNIRSNTQVEATLTV